VGSTNEHNTIFVLGGLYVVIITKAILLRKPKKCAACGRMIKAKEYALRTIIVGFCEGLLDITKYYHFSNEYSRYLVLKWTDDKYRKMICDKVARED